MKAGNIVEWVREHPDKAVHFVLCLALCVYVWAFFFGFDLWLPGVALAVSVPMLAGLAKEFHDRNKDGDYFDPYDLMADFLGVIVGLIPALFIYLN